MLTKADQSDLTWIYDLMDQAFPPQERRTKEGFLQEWQQEAFHLMRLEKGQGFLAYWDLGQWFYVEHFATAKEVRGKGLGGETFGQFLQEAKKPVFFEVEQPNTQWAKRRIAFYERLGCVLNPYPYLQPPYPGRTEGLALFWMSYPQKLTKEEFLSARTQLYAQVYGQKG